MGCPNLLQYAREFIIPIIHQLVDNPPEKIIFKSLEVLAKITIPVEGESKFRNSTGISPPVSSQPSWVPGDGNDDQDGALYPMNDSSVAFALEILDNRRRKLQSRDRGVFSALIQLHAYNLHLIGDLSRVIAYMCRLQPPEFVFVSFAVELDHFVRREHLIRGEGAVSKQPMSQDYQFVSAFIQQMCLVLLNSSETAAVRNALKDCIGYGREAEEKDRRRSRLFHILLHSFSHNLVAATSLCLWGGACRTASLFLKKIDPLDINLVFLLELDKVVEMIERPLFRHLHVRMLETDRDPLAEGSGTMLFQTLKCILMLIPQSASYNVLRDRLVSTSRFRQSVIANHYSHDDDEQNLSPETEVFVSRVVQVRRTHCEAIWETIRAESLESITTATHAVSRSTSAEGKDEDEFPPREVGADRREWLGYASREEEFAGRIRHEEAKRRIQGSQGVIIEEVDGSYDEFSSLPPSQGVKMFTHKTAIATEEPANHDGIVPPATNGNKADISDESKISEGETWKDFWSTQP
jgi:Vacuolar protein 14 C-terminal Fig4p binding